MMRLLRWLFGLSEPEDVWMVCNMCDRGNHVHDVNSGHCIDRFCDCKQGVTVER